MLVYVCCATGNTSGMFCKQIQKASCREQIYVEEIHELGNHLEDALRENELTALRKSLTKNSFAAITSNITCRPSGLHRRCVT